jgi:steroid delta-isomerase-like uncharacterized protein
VSEELERTEVAQLAESWRAAWMGEAGFADCCAADVSYEDPLAYVPLSGTGALEQHATRLRKAFPDVSAELTAPALHAGDHACVAWRVSGTHRGGIAMLPATNSKVTLHGLHYVELADGRIRRARGFFDLYDGAIQLGLLPGHGGLGEATLMLLRGFGLRR